MQSTFIHSLAAVTPGAKFCAEGRCSWNCTAPQQSSDGRWSLGSDKGSWSAFLIVLWVTGLANSAISTYGMKNFYTHLRCWTFEKFILYNSYKFLVLTLRGLSRVRPALLPMRFWVLEHCHFRSFAEWTVDRLLRGTTDLLGLEITRFTIAMLATTAQALQKQGYTSNQDCCVPLTGNCLGISVAGCTQLSTISIFVKVSSFFVH